MLFLFFLRISIEPLIILLIIKDTLLRPCAHILNKHVTEHSNECR